MKILQIINDLSSGGAEKLVADFVPLMRDKGQQVDVLLLRKKGSIYIDDLVSKKISVNWNSEKSLYSLKHVYKIKKFIKNGNYDIINVHLFPSLYFVGIASFFLKKKGKILFTEHSTFNRRRNSIFQILDRIVYEKYFKVIAITNEVKEKMEIHLSKNGYYFEVINNGIDINKIRNAERFDPKRIFKDYNKDQKIICMVARFSEEKDHFTVIKSLKYINDNVKLILIGEGPLKIKCEHLVKELDLGCRVKFLGIRNDVPQILNSIDVGVQSSNWEGFGIAALEIMAAGKPIIASNVPGLRSIVENAGIFFSSGNEKELAEKINKLLNDENFYNKISSACLKRAEKYDINKMVDNYLQFYEKVIEQ